MENLLKNFNVEKMGDLGGVVGHKGNTVVEFSDRESLVSALELDGKPFFDMNLRIIVLEHRGGFNGPRREGPPSDDKNRDFDNWDRRGPLPPMEGGDRPHGGRMPDREFDWNDRRGPLPPGEHSNRRGFDGPSKPHDERDYGNWERRGPPPPREEHGFHHHGDREFGNKGHHNDERNDERNYDNWEHRGPLPPLEEKKNEFGHKPRHHDERNYDSWEHRGPLPSLEEKKNEFGKGFRRQNAPERELDWSHRRDPPPAPEDRRNHNHNNQHRRQHRSGEKPKADDPFDQDWNSSKPAVGVKVAENKHRHNNFKNTHENDNTKKHSEGESNDTKANAASAPAAPPATTATPTPHHHKRLNLLPRSNKAAEVVVPRNAALFGSAKPVDTASKFLEIEAREEKAKLERAKKAEEAAASKSQKKSKKEDVAKSFSALQINEEGKDSEDHKTQAVHEYNQRKKEDLTEAEKTRLREATPEDLESGGWNVVIPKKGGRR